MDFGTKYSDIEYISNNLTTKTSLFTTIENGATVAVPSLKQFKRFDFYLVGWGNVYCTMSLSYEMLCATNSTTYAFQTYYNYPDYLVFGISYVDDQHIKVLVQSNNINFVRTCKACSSAYKQY